MNFNVIQQYQKLGNYDEKEAKLRYVQLCRSLPTYGITFFLIKVSRYIDENFNCYCYNYYSEGRFFSYLDSNLL